MDLLAVTNFEEETRTASSLERWLKYTFHVRLSSTFGSETLALSKGNKSEPTEKNTKTSFLKQI